MEQVDVSQGQGLKLATITVRRACTGCGAPGIYLHDHPIEGWPDKFMGVYVERDDARLGKPVGDTCPNCGAARPADEDHSDKIKE